MRADTLVALDSDGTVLDTMGPKQHRFLQPMLADALGMGPLREAYFACADFVNLRSAARGITRFNAILLALTLFNRHPDVRAAGFPPFDLADLRAFVASGLPQSDAALGGWLRDHPSPFLETLRAWGRAVNAAILASGLRFDPFPGVPEALAALHARSAVAVVSQSPAAVLRQDWDAHGLLRFVDDLAGQERGVKAVQLRSAAEGFAPGRVLMVGDAYGDLQAAQALGCPFFPILPGREADSWRELAEEAYPAFLEGRYDPAPRLAAFTHALPPPDSPPWEAGAVTNRGPRD